MSTLADYNPLEKIRLPGAVIDNPTGLVIVIGPNSSGKTLFLNDIQNYLLTGQQQSIVCKNIAVRKPADLQAFLDDLQRHNAIRELPTNPGHFVVYVPNLTLPSRSQQQINRNPFTYKMAQKAWAEFVPGEGGNNPSFFGTFGPTLVAPLTLEMRRTVCAKSPSFDHNTAAPNTPLQALLLSTKAKDKLASETGEVFGNAAWQDTLSEHNFIQLRVSGSPNLPSAGEMTNPLEAGKSWSIDTEGDGYKSYVGICLSLMLGIKPVSLVDEPELCLHPPQAYHIGRFIGEYATEQKHVTFVATHSSHVLRGILETGKRMTVLRLTRKQKAFQANLLNEEELLRAIRNPRSRAETILDGLFAQGVVLVESEGDREVYQAASEVVKDYASREVHFVPVGETGGFVEVARFYRKLQIPIAIIADLDAISDVRKMTEAIELLCADSDAAAELIAKLREVIQGIKGLPPAITEEGLKESLRQIGGLSMDWNKGDDNIIRHKLNMLVNQIKRLQKLKEGGISSYANHPEIQDGLRLLVSKCKMFGLFFVERGELEDWIPHLMGDTPKGALSKPERATIAASKIREAEQKTGDVWEFISDVLEFLHDARGRT